jgi:hypothetical protein
MFTRQVGNLTHALRQVGSAGNKQDEWAAFDFADQGNSSGPEVGALDDNWESL